MLMSFRAAFATTLMLAACGGGTQKGETKAEPAPTAAAQKNGNQVGATAVDFTVKDEAGNDVTLAQHKGKRSVLLAFYPKDFTGG